MLLGFYGYETIVVAASLVDEAIPYCPVYLSGMSDGWWAALASCSDTTGATIRVSSADGNTQCACYVAAIDTVAKTGLLLFKATSLSASVDTTYRIHAGHASATMPAVTDTYGRNAVFSTYSAFYLPGITTDDISGHGYNLTAVGSPTTTTTPFEGLSAAEYNGSSQYHEFTGSLPSIGWSHTLEAIGRNDDDTLEGDLINFASRTDLNPFTRTMLSGSNTGDPARWAGRGNGGESPNIASTYPTAFTAGQYHYVVGSKNGSTGAGTVTLDGSTTASSTWTLSTATFTCINIGALVRSSSPIYLDGGVALACVSTGVKTTSYRSTVYNAWYNASFITPGGSFIYQHTVTTTGATNPAPANTTRAYKGVSSARPPSSGGNLTSQTEFSDTEYTNAGDSNDVRVSQTGNSTRPYAGQLFEFLIPEAYRDVSRIDVGIEGWASDGYANNYGFALYLRNNTPSWVFVGNSSSTMSDSLRVGGTTSVSTYVDANYIVRLLGLSQAIDDNGNGAEMHVDVAYLVVTYTPVVPADFLYPKIIQY